MKTKKKESVEEKKRKKKREKKKKKRKKMKEKGVLWSSPPPLSLSFTFTFDTMYYRIVYDKDSVQEVHSGFKKMAPIGANKPFSRASEITEKMAVKACWINGQWYEGVVTEISSTKIHITTAEATPKTSPEAAKRNKVFALWKKKKEKSYLFDCSLFFFFLSFSFFFLLSFFSILQKVVKAQEVIIESQRQAQQAQLVKTLVGQAPTMAVSSPKQPLFTPSSPVASAPLHPRFFKFFSSLSKKISQEQGLPHYDHFVAVTS